MSHLRIVSTSPLPTLADIVRQYPDWLDELLTDEKAAEFSGWSRATLATMRTRRRGPRFYKMADRSVRYTRRDLLTCATLVEPADRRPAA